MDSPSTTWPPLGHFRSFQPTGVLVFMFLAACGGGSPSVEPDAMPNLKDVPRVTTAACKFSVESLVAAGVEHECGNLTVFEDRDQAQKLISLHYLRIFGEATSPNATIYLAGGPGGNGDGIASSLPRNTELMDGLLSNGDFLVIAQRGTSLSEPDLSCSECDTFVASTDADLSAYNTAFNADDVDDLRLALGYEKLNLYGISYGSRLGLEVLRRHGQNVRAAALGGLVPPQVIWPASTPASFYGALNALNQSCADAGACGEEFGDLVDRFRSGIRNLNDVPLQFTDDGDEFVISGNTYASLIFQMLYSKSTYAMLPLVINDLAQSNLDRVQGYVADIFRWAYGPRTTSLGLYYSVNCGELLNPPDPSAFDNANQGVPEDIKEVFGRNWESLSTVCETWPKGNLQQELAQGVSSDVPALLMNGELDPITPPRYGEIAARGLSSAKLVNFANSGHGASLQSQCGNEVLLAFLQDPTSEVSSCPSSVTTSYTTPSSALFAGSLTPELPIAEMPLLPQVQKELRKAVRRLR